jgi:hypothetical protein
MADLDRLSELISQLTGEQPQFSGPLPANLVNLLSTGSGIGLANLMNCCCSGATIGFAVTCFSSS